MYKGTRRKKITKRQQRVNVAISKIRYTRVRDKEIQTVVPLGLLDKMLLSCSNVFFVHPPRRTNKIFTFFIFRRGGRWFLFHCIFRVTLAGYTREGSPKSAVDSTIVPTLGVILSWKTVFPLYVTSMGREKSTSLM
ncbi:hypothetical protein HMPREF9944_02557 [Segatella maculosa OT 289]|uniref:Uncharacterized protein n=1 Tax=Segatella maculosa OT 289 TaxID=999422 RepID=H1HQW3_9BACT|nr:hypothetical protein HMPREF9944_02557 [Segatella maculosa OT 289]